MAASELHFTANDHKHADVVSGGYNQKQRAERWRKVASIWSGRVYPPASTTQSHPRKKQDHAWHQGSERTNDLHRKTARLGDIFPRHAARFRPAHLERFFRGYHLPYTTYPGTGATVSSTTRRADRGYELAQGGHVVRKSRTCATKENVRRVCLGNQVDPAPSQCLCPGNPSPGHTKR